MSIVDDYREATRNDAKLRVYNSLRRCLTLLRQLRLDKPRKEVVDRKVGDLLEVAVNLACASITVAQAACAVRLAQRTSDQLERLVRWSKGIREDSLPFSNFDSWSRREIAKFKD